MKEIFNPKILKIKKATIHSELFENSLFDLPLTLFWKISIPLEDFQIGNYTINYPEIELGLFTLPYKSISPKFDRTVKLLKSWKELPNSVFDFSGSFIDNIGSIYYNIKAQDFEEEIVESFDNIVDIHQIEFGKIFQNKIAAKLKIQIHFDSFNMQEPPFANDFACDIFDVEVELEIKEVKLLNPKMPVTNTLEAVAISETALQIHDYEVQVENKDFFVSLTEKQNRIFFTFKPKF